MATRTKELTDFDVKAATARDTDYKVPDGDGLYARAQTVSS